MKNIYDIDGNLLVDNSVKSRFKNLIRYFYKKDSATNTFYTMVLIPQTNYDGEKQYPFVLWSNYPQGGNKSTYEMNKERNGYFTRHLVKNQEMRDILDTTLQVSDDGLARYANKIKKPVILRVDSKKQSKIIKNKRFAKFVKLAIRLNHKPYYYIAGCKSKAGNFDIGWTVIGAIVIK